MRTNLTPAGIRAAIRLAATNRNRVELNDPATPGLNLRVATSGRTTWTWMGRDADGRVRRFGLGHGPTISIAEARRKARKPGRGGRRRGRSCPARQGPPQRCQSPPAWRDPGHACWPSTAASKVPASGPGPLRWSRRSGACFARISTRRCADLTVGALQITVDGHPKPKSASFGVRCLMTVLRWAAAAGRQLCVARSAGAYGAGRQAAPRSCAVRG